MGHFDKHSMSKPFGISDFVVLQWMSLSQSLCSHRLGSHCRLLWQKHQSFSLITFINSTSINFECDI